MFKIVGGAETEVYDRCGFYPREGHRGGGGDGVHSPEDSPGAEDRQPHAAAAGVQHQFPGGDYQDHGGKVITYLLR